MSGTIFFISDTHFGHKNILKFLRRDGTPLRPGFHYVDAMNEFIIEQWNATVRPQDKVYHCGDFEMGLTQNELNSIGHRLNGHKRLILGNHDKLSARKYLEAGFEEVYGSRQFEGIICTHIPIHPESLSRWKVNVHGHLHYGKVYIPDTFHSVVDLRYRNVSVEMLDDYRPISLEEIRNGK